MMYLRMYISERFVIIYEKRKIESNLIFTKKELNNKIKR